MFFRTLPCRNAYIDFIDYLVKNVHLNVVFCALQPQFTDYVFVTAPESSFRQISSKYFSHPFSLRRKPSRLYDVKCDCDEHFLTSRDLGVNEKGPNDPNGGDWDRCFCPDIFITL